MKGLTEREREKKKELKRIEGVKEFKGVQIVQRVKDLRGEIAAEGVTK